jgi:L-amino acid N-acyltransferase YncA
MTIATIRFARESDLERLTEIYNYYVMHTPITFDLAKRANTSFTYLGSYADSRMTCQLISWQLPRRFENMKPSSGNA